MHHGLMMMRATAPGEKAKNEKRWFAVGHRQHQTTRSIEISSSHVSDGHPTIASFHLFHVT
jgi:hypothetical protein